MSEKHKLHNCKMVEFPNGGWAIIGTHYRAGFENNEIAAFTSYADLLIWLAQQVPTDKDAAIKAA